MLNFDVHCFTEVFAKECYDYIKSVLVCQNTPNAVVTLSTYCDFFIKYLIKNAVTLLDMDILPSFIADDFDQGVLTNVSDITVRKGMRYDLSLIHEFKKVILAGETILNTIYQVFTMRILEAPCLSP